MILCHKYPEIFVGGQTGEISFLYESGQIEHILLYSSYETYFTSNPQLSSSASFLRLNVLSSLN